MKFANDRSLSQREIDTLVAWADGGALKGDEKDAPAPRNWVEGWTIPKPDVVIDMPVEIEVPATGEIDYQYVSGFTDNFGNGIRTDGLSFYLGRRF